MDQMMPWDVTSLRVDHDLLAGYRWLDHHGHEPEFPFGFGLSYTRFELGEMRIARSGSGFEIEVDVRNSGARVGAEVVQLYLGYANSRVFRAEKEMKGFGRIELEPGAEATLVIRVRDEDLRFYDADAGAWELEACVYAFCVGTSSRDLPQVERWRYADGTWQSAR
jgi:beta-glucosidase